MVAASASRGLRAAIASAMAGNDRGVWFVPEIDDEAVVAFDRGDPSWPIVLGFLWNGVDAAPSTLRSLASLMVGREIEVVRPLAHARQLADVTALEVDGLTVAGDRGDLEVLGRDRVVPDHPAADDHREGAVERHPGLRRDLDRGLGGAAGRDLDQLAPAPEAEEGDADDRPLGA